MGTPEFATPTLRALATRPDVASILAVYTQPDRPAGRGQKLTKPPVKILAEELKLPVFQPENVNLAEENRKLADMMADVVVVVAYAQFLGKAILNIPRLGCVNVHSSLLPKYRGAAPIQYAIWKGETETGVSTMRLVQKMDAGPTLLQRSIPIGPNMMADELHDKLAVLGAQLLIETLEQLRDGKATEVAQDEAYATYAKLIRKEDGLIRWESPGIEIVRQIRAMHPWPGTYARSTRGLMKVHRVNFHPNLSGAPANAVPGGVFLGTGSLFVKCADGWLELLTIQPEGKPQMTTQQFLNGLRDKKFSFERGVS